MDGALITPTLIEANVVLFHKNVSSLRAFDGLFVRR